MLRILATLEIIMAVQRVEGRSYWLNFSQSYAMCYFQATIQYQGLWLRKVISTIGCTYFFGFTVVHFPCLFHWVISCGDRELAESLV